jgi:hypothetical protein
MPSAAVTINAGEMTLREDAPRNSNGGSDLRYRYSLWPWSALLVVEYLPTLHRDEKAHHCPVFSTHGRVGSQPSGMGCESPLGLLESNTFP